MIENKIAVYSPHTAFDSAEFGINQQLVTSPGADDVQPLRPFGDDWPELGSGRRESCLFRSRSKHACESAEEPLAVRADWTCGQDAAREVQRSRWLAGSGGQFVSEAVRQGCELLVTGEANFHTCLEADAQGVALLLLGHFFSERFAVVSLAQRLAAEFSDIRVWASCQETDPLRWV